MAWGRHRDLSKAGSRAPDFRLARLDGGEASLTEILANGPALLAFFKVSCPLRQLTFPDLERIHSPGELSIWGVSQNGPADTRAFCSEYGITFPKVIPGWSKKDVAEVGGAAGMNPFLASESVPEWKAG